MSFSRIALHAQGIQRGMFLLLAGAEVVDKRDLVAARKEGASLTVLENFIGQVLLIHLPKTNSLEKLRHPREGIDPGDIEFPRLFQDRLYQPLAHAPATKGIAHHEGAHFREIDHIDMEGHAAAEIAGGFDIGPACADNRLLL